MELSIQVEGIDRVVSKFGRLATFTNLRPAMSDSLNKVWNEVAKYPPPPASSAFPGFKSEKQRRFFFAALRDGLIQVPYRRTGTLGRSWTTRIDVTVNSIEGRIGTNIIYAPWVQDKGQQAMIHQGRWQTVQDTLERLTNWIVRRFQREIDKLLQLP
jgi:hypothetical protein